MDKYTYEGSNRVIIERFLLFVLTIINCVMITISVKQYDGVHGALLMLTGIALCWIIYVAGFQNYEFRAFFDTIVTLLGIIVYSGYTGDIDKILPMFMVFIVLTGMFGIEELIYASTVATVLLYGYHGLILKTISFATVQERSEFIIQVVNVLFMQYLVFMWTKRNAGGSNRLLKAAERMNCFIDIHRI